MDKNFIKNKIKSNGYTEIIKNDYDNLTWLKFGVLNLKQGESWYNREKDYETFLVILSGKCDISFKHSEFKDLGKRKDVFSGKAYGCYIGIDKAYKIIAKKDLEVAVCMAKAKKKLDNFIIEPMQVKKRRVGRGNYKRHVYDILKEKDQAHRLIIGETINFAGNWSSYPPHKHEKDDGVLESRHEEIYFFKTQPEQGFGFQSIFTDNDSNPQASKIGNNHVSIIPRGYHPVCAEPGTKIYYLWILAGNRRKLIMRELEK